MIFQFLATENTEKKIKNQTAKNQSVFVQGTSPRRRVKVVFSGQRTGKKIKNKM